MAKSTNWIIVGVIALVFLAGYLIWSPNKKAPAPLMRHELSGVVLAIKPEAHRLAVHNDDMPGTMRPMDMEYDIKDPAALSTLKVGERIHATLVTDGESLWQLENISVTGKK